MLALLALPSSADAARVKGKLEGFRLLRNPVWAEAGHELYASWLSVERAGRPVPFARVTLTCADGNALSLATLADGTVVFHPGLDRLG